MAFHTLGVLAILRQSWRKWEFIRFVFMTKRTGKMAKNTSQPAYSRYAVKLLLFLIF